MKLKNRIKLGIAPIGWTNDDLPELGGDIPFEQCIDEMAQAGYAGCEVGNKFPRDPSVLRAQLAARNLQICNQWFTYTLSTDPFEQVAAAFEQHLDFLEAMASPVVGGGACGGSIQGLDVPIFGQKPTFSDGQWQALSKGLNALGKRAADRGMKLCLHHHMGTGVQNLAEVDRLMAETDPNYVFLNYDCGHFYFAGEDPLIALKKHIHRVGHVHLKEIRPAVLSRVKAMDMSFLDAVKSGVFTVPGDPEGCIDIPGILKLLDQHQYEGWLVVEAEQDPAKAPPLQYAQIAKEFIDDILDN